MSTTPLTCWIDASAGIAGDMLLAALLDAGASLPAVQDAVDALLPGTIEITATPTHRAGLAATAVHVRLLVPDQPHRPWSRIRDLLRDAPLPGRVRDRALAAFTALATAEATVHGVTVDDVHFHEVGGWDSIADVVGVAAAVEALGVDEFATGELALGSGLVLTQHGTLPVPVPAVVELCRGRPVLAGGDGELATPTGVALLTTLAPRSGPLPAMTLERTGTGAGTRDRPDRPNVVRVLLGTRPASTAEDALPRDDGLTDTQILVETTVDDLDPRIWPTVIDDLLTAGATDAWLTPVLMKKGRPGHLLSALTTPALAAVVRRLVLERTSTLGVRQTVVRREVLDRAWTDVTVHGGRVAVKIGHRAGTVVHVTPEFEDAARLAEETGRSLRDVLTAALAAAESSGTVPGSVLNPATTRGHRFPA